MLMGCCHCEMWRAGKKVKAMWMLTSQPSLPITIMEWVELILWTERCWIIGLAHTGKNDIGHLLWMPSTLHWSIVGGSIVSPRWYHRSKVISPPNRKCNVTSFIQRRNSWNCSTNLQSAKQGSPWWVWTLSRTWTSQKVCCLQNQL